MPGCSSSEAPCSTATGRATASFPAVEQAAGSGLAIVLGIVLDGLPESAVLGLTVLEAGSVSVAFLAAVFLSNVPEAIAATSGLASAGWRGSRILGLWVLVAVGVRAGVARRASACSTARRRRRSA